MTRLFVALAAVCLAALAPAQGLTPLPSDLSTLPTLGIDKTDAMRFLDRRMQFAGLKEKNGLEKVSGTPDGKTTVVFMCADDAVVAGSVTIPVMGAQVAEQDAVKSVVLIRFLMNLVPDADWGQYPLGQIISELSRPENERWIETIDNIQITAARARPGFIVFRVVNEQIVHQRYDLGDF